MRQNYNQYPFVGPYSFFQIVSITILLLFASSRLYNNSLSSSEGESRWKVSATSINYGISQQPITDINQLMPRLCQNQTMICEGSFCIPGIRKCVCDLRMPVQFGRFCLRQVDIETKCFVTNQCNHTIKDAVCIDSNSNAILDAESSKFKLDQWQQLNELRQLSQSTLSKEQVPTRQTHLFTSTESSQKSMFLFDGNNNNNNFDGFNFEARDDVIINNARNSPYEINYNTPELLSQNHTRRRTNNSDRSASTNSILTVPISSYNLSNDTRLDDKSVLIRNNISETNPLSSTRASTISTITSPTDSSSTMSSSQTTSEEASISNNFESSLLTTEQGTNGRSGQDPYTSTRPETTGTVSTTTSSTTLSYSDLTSRKKMVIKSPNWPPGICSCPVGYMFDSMLRKCLTLSLADSHCQVDSDCKQVSMTHCSIESKRCNCDEPLVWNQTELACVRPKVPIKTENSTVKKEGFFENLLSPLILAKLLPDYTMMLLFFVIMVIISTLIILKLTVKCFSSSSSALISPKKKKPTQAGNLNPRSPYATLRRPDHKPSSQLSNFTQATRGRILNYDFESENPKVADDANSPSPLPPSGNTLRSNKEASKSTVKSHKHHTTPDIDNHNKSLNSGAKKDSMDDQLMELNDNISVNQLESESKSDNSINIIPGPSPTQQPPYMLRSAMMGQGSAIATAAAAVANKRMQLALKKNLEQQSTGKLANGSPVYL